MRILVTTQPAYGHFFPLVPLSKELIKNNHDICFITSKSFSSVVEDSGFKCKPMGLDWVESKASDTFKELSEISDSEKAIEYWMKHIFAGKIVEHILHDLINFCITWKPDLIIYDSYEFAGPLVAEYLGIPKIKSGPMAFFPMGELSAMISQTLSVYRKALKLPTDSDLSIYYNGIEFVFIPKFLISKDAQFSKNTYFFKPHIYDGNIDAFNNNDLINRIDKNKKTIYVTLGTVFNDSIELWDMLFDSLEEYLIEYNIIVTIPNNEIIIRIKEKHSNAFLTTSYIPQSQIFKYCHLVISHGGQNTIISALMHNLLQIIIPRGADNFYNASLCQDNGIAKVLNFDEKIDQNLKKAIKELFDNSSYYKHNIAIIRNEIELMPDLDKAVSIISNLLV